MEPRIALVGWAVHTGIGYQNFDLWNTGRFCKWIIPRHPKLGVAPDMAYVADPEIMPIVDLRDGPAKHLDGVDAMFASECPYSNRQDTFDVCRSRGIVTIFATNIEWLPAPGTPDWNCWACKPDMIYCPTRYTVGVVKRFAREATSTGLRCDWAGSIVGDRWGVNMPAARLHRRIRTRADRFLFANGWGGVGDRKGLDYVIGAARRLPRARFIIRTQRPITCDLANVDIMVGDIPDRWSLYDHGDVYLAPSRWEGIGLSLYEAQACGLPVVTTAAAPMNECGPAKLIACEPAAVTLAGRRIDAYHVDMRSFVGIIAALAGQPIEGGSVEAVDYVEAHHNIADVAADIVAAVATRIDSKRVTA